MHLRTRFLSIALPVVAALCSQLSCGTRTNLYCELPIPFERETPNLYFVLDRSGSMETDDKWGTVRQSVVHLIQRIGDRARFGAAIYPPPGSTECEPGAEILALAQPGDTDDLNETPPLAQRFLVASNLKPRGGTPTAATLRTLTPRITSFGGHTFVVLATDGGPNCNTAAKCDVDKCTLNIEHHLDCRPDEPPNCCTDARDCLDDDSAIAAVAALKDLQIPTFVVGIPGSAPYAEVLEKMATAAGTARSKSPLYYRVDSVDEDALTSTLIDIVKKASTSCTMPLTFIPLGGGLRVALDGTEVAADPVNGWTLDGMQLIIHGQSCDSLKDGAEIDVRGLDQCRQL